MSERMTRASRLPASSVSMSAMPAPEGSPSRAAHRRKNDRRWALLHRRGTGAAVVHGGVRGPARGAHPLLDVGDEAGVDGLGRDPDGVGHGPLARAAVG